MGLFIVRFDLVEIFKCMIILFPFFQLCWNSLLIPVNFLEFVVSLPWFICGFLVRCSLPLWCHWYGKFLHRKEVVWRYLWSLFAVFCLVCDLGGVVRGGYWIIKCSWHILFIFLFHYFILWKWFVVSIFLLIQFYGD